MAQSILQVVIGALDPERSAAAWVQHLGWRVVERSALSGGLAAAWAAPECAGAAQILLQPPTGARNFVRFVATAAADDPIGTLGWTGIELLVENLDTVWRALDGTAFEPFNPPQALSLSPKVRFAQVVGPNRELLFLNQMDEPAFGVGRAECYVDRPFVVACAVTDVEETAALCATSLNVAVEPPIDVVMPALNRAYGLSDGTKHPLGLIRLDGPFMLEFDQYPLGARTRHREPGYLPRGIAVVSVGQNTPTVFGGAGSAIYRDDAPYEGAACRLIALPDGSLLELAVAL